MKILYISDSSIPSASANSIHVMKMCQAFANHDHDVTLIGKKTTACDSTVKNAFDFYGVKQNFGLKTFPWRSFPGSGRFFNIFLPFFAFGNADVVYTRSFYAALWYSVFGKRIAFEIHEPYETKSIFLKYLFSFIVWRGAVRRWIVISNNLKNHLSARFRLPEGSITVAHDGADPFLCEQQSLKSSEKLSVGYVGSLLRGKGMELLMPLAARMPEVTFHVVGGSKGDIEQLKSSFPGSSHNVVFHGFVHHSETPQLISSFDILIAPYQKYVYVKDERNSNNIAQWMSPLKIFEYMAAGKPIVTSDLPVLREVLEHRRTAMLCEPDRIEDWISAIRLLAHDSRLRTEMSSNAKTKFLESYTWKTRAFNILNDLTA